MIDISPTLLVAISIPILLGLLALGIPIYLSLGLVGVLGTVLLVGPPAGLSLLGAKAFTTVSKYQLWVAPLFILMGLVAFHAGLTRGAFDTVLKWTSRLPGGLAIATVMACAMFGACCGSSVATAATMGSVAIPEMRAAGYDKKLACGCAASGGLLAYLIPPSIILVIYGVITQTSIGALLIGAILPGIVSTIVFSIGIMFQVRRNPNIAPPTRGYPWRERFIALRGTWPIALLFLIVIGGIYFGVATISETASLGALAAIVLLLLNKRREAGKALKGALLDTLQTTSMIFIIIICSVLYGWFLVTGGIPTAISLWITSLDIPPILVLLLTLSFFLPLGCILDDLPCLLITMPLLHPVLVGQFGFSCVTS